MPRIQALAIVAIAALVVASPLAAQVTFVPSETVAARLLAAHNVERARLGLKPLVWSAKLADHSKQWAQTLAESDKLEHAPDGADGDEGENLWNGTKHDYTPDEMIAFFIDEAKHFKRGTFPDVSTTGRWDDVGHYTQLVWKDTREVGCTIASNQRRDFLVCRYWPAGNIKGQPVYDYAATKAAVAPPTTRLPTEHEVVDHPDAHQKKTGAPASEPAATSSAPAAVPAPVSPSGPKKRASKKRRRGG